MFSPECKVRRFSCSHARPGCGNMIGRRRQIESAQNYGVTGYP